MIIAQLSDIHANGSKDRLERLDRVLAWLRPMRPDAIIVSGDLAEDDFADSYRAVLKRLRDMETLFRVVPGNVDDHGRLADVFGGDMGWTGTRPLHSSGVVGGALRLIGLDVTLPGQHHGDAAPALDWLAEELQRDALPVLVFQHQHPFLCGIDGKDQNRCHGAEGLGAVLSQAGSRVLGITCGHVHRPMFARLGDIPASMAPSVTRANRLSLDGKASDIVDPPGLLLHHVQDGRLVSHVVMVGER